MSRFIIKLSAKGAITTHEWPKGTLTEQNKFMTSLIGKPYDLYERVKPNRLYTAFKCQGIPSRTEPGRSVSMLIDEEGLYHNLPINAIASWLYEYDKHGSPIVGNVLFVGERYTEDGDLEFCPLADYTLLALIQNLTKARECMKKLDTGNKFFGKEVQDV